MSRPLMITMSTMLILSRQRRDLDCIELSMTSVLAPSYGAVFTHPKWSKPLVGVIAGN